MGNRVEPAGKPPDGERAKEKTSGGEGSTAAKEDDRRNGGKNQKRVSSAGGATGCAPEKKVKREGKEAKTHAEFFSTEGGKRERPAGQFQVQATGPLKEKHPTGSRQNLGSTRNLGKGVRNGREKSAAGRCPLTNKANGSRGESLVSSLP